MPIRTRHRGFSLVELSIVLVILGLLVGGVLSGQSLIRAAELRSVGTDFSRYHASLYTFRDKYMALPGDMTNATKFWGVADGTTDGASVACFDTASSGKATCNGNGNGIIMDADNKAYGELWRAWQHLANAGLVEGRYIGTIKDKTTAELLGNIVPAGRLGSSGFQFWSEAMTAQGWDSGVGTTEVKGFLRFAAPYTGTDAPIRIGTPILKGEEAWTIDKKLDDGKPGMGRMTGHAAKAADGSSLCVSAFNPASAEYKMAASDSKCTVDFQY